LSNSDWLIIVMVWSETALTPESLVPRPLWTQKYPYLLIFFCTLVWLVI